MNNKRKMNDKLKDKSRKKIKENENKKILKIVDDRFIRIKPSIDVVFKKLFGSNKNKDILVDFLNGILKYFENINFNSNNLRILGSELNVDKIDKKNPRLDMLACKYIIKKDKKSENIIQEEEEEEDIIEIQIHISNKDDMFKRSVFYASKLISQSVILKDNYNKMPKVIMINILDYNMFDDDIGYRYIYHNEKDFYKGKFYQNVNGKLVDKNNNIVKNENNKEIELDKGEIDEKLVSIHFIELKKFKNNNAENTIPWIKFINEPNNNIFKNENTPYVYKKARSELLILQNDKKFIELYKSRLYSRISRNSTLSYSREKGRINGRNDSRKKNSVMFTFKFLIDKMRLSEIFKISRLSENEIRYMDQFLKESNRNVEDLAIKLNIKKEMLIIICNKLNISFEDENKK
eukprot:jgi/Orpsp1_1/1180599/evm.model.c7180000074056.1